MYKDFERFNTMNFLNNDVLHKANEEAIYNLYLYLADKSQYTENDTFKSIVNDLEENQKLHYWKDKDIYRLEILKNANNNNSILANSKIYDLTRQENGLTACSFIKPNGNISVIFKGTGSGEWIDNGEGLSGIPEENTYTTYEKDGNIMYNKIVQKDYATDQQVEALNWFSYIASKNNWTPHTKITVSGHSKGGNKAQFVAIHSGLVSECYSFCGQGFSPEAIDSFKNQYGKVYEERKEKIYSFSADNDYVNVLGMRLVPDKNIYYIKSHSGLHNIEAILDKNGKFRLQTEQGKLSLYVENISKELMSQKPSTRQYATLGIMNVFQKYLGQGVPVNNDSVSIEKTIAGIGLSIGYLLRQLKKNKDL